MGRTILEVNVVDAEKRRFPSKHYVYVIHVHWSDSTSYVIYRRYSRFFDFQVRLLDMFPDEAGSKDPSQRIIPFLPGKKWIGRSNVRKVAMERLSVIDEYCKALIRLPSKISECPFVFSFFETLPEDLTPTPANQDANKRTSVNEAEVSISEPIRLDNYVAIADHKKQKSNELNLQGGDIVEVIEKNHTGWWFVSLEDEQGWVPATYLKKVEEDDSDDFQNIDMASDMVKFVTIHNYKAQLDDEMSFDKGVVVKVIKKNLDGWWFVRYQDKEGWVPATYLHEVHHQNNIESKLPTEKIGNVMDLTKPKQQESKLQPIQEVKKPFLPSHLTVLTDESVIAGSRSPMARHKPPPRRGSIQVTHRGTGSVKEKPEYVTIGAFSARMNDGISFKQGQKVKVMEKAPGGWWYVNIDNKEGWAPSNYIEKQSQTKSASSQAESSGLSQIAEVKPSQPLTPKIFDKNANKTPGTSPKPSPPRKPVISSQPVKNSGNGEVTNELQQALNALKPAKSKEADTGSKVKQSPVKLLLPPVMHKAPKPKAAPPPRPPPPTVKSDNLYRVLADYTDGEEGTLSLEEGMKVEVVEKGQDGWWLVKTSDQRTGWAPQTYLVKET